MKFFVSHPEVQHSAQLVSALASIGARVNYIHGAPVRGQLMPDANKVQHWYVPFCRYGRVILNRVFPRRTALRLYYKMLWMFDGVSSRLINFGDLDALIAYENSAIKQFERAKQHGVPCILDHASVHYSLQQKMIPSNVSPSFQERINLRKKRELELADLIVVCSSFAARSFVEAGVPSEKIRIVNLGCNFDVLEPRKLPEDERDGYLKFLFVGRLTRLKGADLLAEAITELKREGYKFECSIAASVQEGEKDIVDRFSGVAELLGKVPHSKLPELYRSFDCVVAPSRFDSFALIVGESLSCGVPVIVSDHVGAKDLIAEGKNGWIFKANDLDDLKQIMRRCLENPQLLRSMSSEAFASARYNTWSRYRVQLSEVVLDFLRECDDCHDVGGALSGPSV